MKSKFNLILTLLLVFFVQAFHAQDRKVSGVVKDNDGATLPFVNVVVKGTKVSAQTDIDGKYSINAAANQTLVFSFIGMKNQEIVASSQKLDVKMTNVGTDLVEVVVTAMNIKRNTRDLGYTVSKVKAADITENSEPDLLRSLSGKVAGVNINSSTGVAGASNQILIRGISSFSGRIQPLFVVDGIAYSNSEVESSSQNSGGGGYESGISSLDPNNIASVSVLKSTAAAALYGSRASNGVIVITTKTGSSNNKKDQKMSVNFGTGTFFENIANLPDYQNTYGAGAQFIAQNANGSWGARFDTPGESNGLINGTIPTWPALKGRFPDLFGDRVAYVAKPNNVKDLFRTGIVQDNTIGLNYVGKDGSFSVTISDLNQDGYIPFNTYNRTALSVGGTFKLSQKLTAGANMSVSDSRQVGGFFGEQQITGASSAFARTLFIARNWDLNLPYVDPVTGGSVTPNAAFTPANGVVNQFDHPLWSLENDQIKTGSTRVVSGLNLNYEINKNISATYRIGYNKYFLNRDEIRDLASRAAGGLGALRKDSYNEEDIESTLMVNFDYSLNENFGLKAILGNNVLQNKVGGLNVLGEGFQNAGIFTLENTSKVTAALFGDYKETKRQVGFFADVTFSYRNFLFLNATGRNDLSSTLQSDRNSYFYPSVSGSFVVTDALKLKSNVLTFAKIRASYAKVGLDAVSEFRAAYFEAGNTFSTLSTIRNQADVNDILVEPEFTTEKEIGLDLEFFKQRIVLDMSIYNKLSDNLITRISVPGATGADNLLTNLGSMENKGFELGLTLVPLKTKDFRWTLFTNYSQNKNKVLSLKEGLERVNVRGGTVSYIIPGESFGVFYGDKFARDANGNLLINPSSGGVIAVPEPAVIGDPNAKFKMSFINTFMYKGFSLKTQFDWKEGGDVYSTTIQSLLGRGVTKDTEDRENSKVIPGFYGNADGTPILDVNGNQIPNTVQLTTNDLYFSPAGANSNTFGINTVDEASVFDGTVYRLREASLTYDLPAKFLDKTPFGKISFSVMGNNLWYFAPNVPKYTNFDPDATSFGSSRVQGIEVSAAPTAKRYGFKINLTF